MVTCKDLIIKFLIAIISLSLSLISVIRLYYLFFYKRNKIHIYRHIKFFYGIIIRIIMRVIIKLG